MAPALVFVAINVLGDYRQELVCPTGVIGESKRIRYGIDDAFAAVDPIAAVTGRISFARNVLALEVELVEGFGELHVWHRRRYRPHHVVEQEGKAEPQRGLGR